MSVWLWSTTQGKKTQSHNDRPQPHRKGGKMKFKYKSETDSSIAQVLERIELNQKDGWEPFTIIPVEQQNNFYQGQPYNLCLEMTPCQIRSFSMTAQYVLISRKKEVI